MLDRLKNYFDGSDPTGLSPVGLTFCFKCSACQYSKLQTLLNQDLWMLTTESWTFTANCKITKISPDNVYQSALILDKLDKGVALSYQWRNLANKETYIKLIIEKITIYNIPIH